MGCDIHLLVETRCTYQGRRSIWERALPPASVRETPWQVKRGEATFESLDAYAAVSWATRWYDHRNYRAFSMLANVRNGSGFAGVQTGQGFIPISEPKGWPTDPGPEVAAFIRGADGDNYPRVEGDVFPGDHSESWLTLRELDAYDWQQQTTQCCGVIPLAEYAKRKAEGVTGEPDSYCGWTSGPGIVVIEEKDADAQMAAGGIVEPEGQRTYVRVWWGMTYAEAAGDFYTRVLPGLRSLRRDDAFYTGPDDIRIVFNFDS